MHKVISNTTPILSLLKIDKLILLKELYGKIIIPEAVFKEIETGKEKPYYQNLSYLDWIQIQKIKNPDSKLFIFEINGYKKLNKFLFFASIIFLDVI
jgi:hypothetical protein